MNKIELASILKYPKKNKFFIHSYSRFQNGGSIASSPFLWIDFSEEAMREVIKGMLEALASTKENQLRPTNWNESYQIFLKDAGFKNGKDFYDKALNVEVVHKDGLIILTPMINNGTKGFENVPNAEITLPDNSTVEDLILTLNTAFNKCE